MAQILLDNGEVTYKTERWVSHIIYTAYHSGKPWDAENYIRVEVDPLYIWMTKLEHEELSKITNEDEVSPYIRGINVQVIWADEFEAWQAGKVKPQIIASLPPLERPID